MNYHSRRSGENKLLGHAEERPIQLPGSQRPAEMAISFNAGVKVIDHAAAVRTAAMPAQSNARVQDQKKFQVRNRAGICASLRTSCQERKQRERAWLVLVAAGKIDLRAPAPCGVTMYGRIPTANLPSTTGRTSRAYSQAWITRPDFGPAFHVATYECLAECPS